MENKAQIQLGVLQHHHITLINTNITYVQVA
jgi:hypothetical protein